MALYAFDGTWNKDKKGTDRDTNVLKCFEAYKQAYKKPGEALYIPGVGTRFGILGKAIGGITGAGGRSRVKKALKQLRKNFKNGDTTIDIVGFSRGAALALQFANTASTARLQGPSGAPPPRIRFVGLWDVVPSFGIPGNQINIGYVLTVPDNVNRCFHAMALDERRRTFPLTRVAVQVRDARKKGKMFEVWFRGVHSDIGGGNKNLGLSSITLHWMFKRAQSAGLKIPATAVSRQKKKKKPSTKTSSNFDLIKDPFRPVRWTDVVHESVRRRSSSGKKKHNNPPAGLRVVNDAGKILPKRFR